jgi:hypothetical protein
MDAPTIITLDNFRARLTLFDFSIFDCLMPDIPIQYTQRIRTLLRETVRG